MAMTGLELARIWSEAPALLPHSAGCACAGHVGLHLDPAAVEADVLDYLSERYSSGVHPELVALLQARRDERGITFASWLTSLDAVRLPEAARGILLADLGVTIASLASKGSR